MKIIFLSLVVLLGLGTCAHAINPEYQQYLKNKYRNDASNFEAGEFKSIHGCFDGQNDDTLTLFPVSGQMGDNGFGYDKWIVVSMNGTIPSKTYQSWWPSIVYEGDLDGNGCDEYGVFLSGQQGCWETYTINTVYKGKNNEFLTIQHYGCNDDEPDSIAEPGKKKGQIKVQEYKWLNDDIQRVKSTKTVTKFLN